MKTLDFSTSLLTTIARFRLRGVLPKSGRQVDRSCRDRAAEADSAMVVRECTTREDADSGIKKSILKQKNRAVVQNFDGNESEFYEEEASSDSEEGSYSCE